MVEIATERQKRLVAANLVDNHKYRGRSLKVAIPEFGLRKRNRLESSELLLITSEFEEQQVPFKVHFFVGKESDRVQHRSPIMMIHGMNLKRWGIDILHSWHGGPLGVAISFTIKQLLSTSIWRPAIADLEPDEKTKLALMAFKSELWAYYKDMKKDEDWKAVHREAK